MSNQRPAPRNAARGAAVTNNAPSESAAGTIETDNAPRREMRRGARVFTQADYKKERRLCIKTVEIFAASSSFDSKFFF